MASLLALTLAITPIAIPKEVKAESNMPSAVDLSTSPYFPEIENQGRVGCCVAMSEVYYQFTYDSSDIIFIILYVYATIFISVCVYRLDNGFLV